MLYCILLIDPLNFSHLQVKFNVHFIYLVLIITMCYYKHIFPIFYNSFGFQLLHQLINVHVFSIIIMLCSMQQQMTTFLRKNTCKFDLIISSWIFFLKCQSCSQQQLWHESHLLNNVLRMVCAIPIYLRGTINHGINM